MAEVDLLLVLVPLEHRKIDDPAELELLRIHQAKLRPHPCAGETCELVEGVRLTGGEEHRVADLQVHLLTEGFGPFRAKVLGDGPCAALLAFPPKDVGEAGLTFALGPVVHPITESPRSASRRRDGPDLRLWSVEDTREDTEAAAAEMCRNVLHLDRVAQVRLVRAVLADRGAIGNARKRAFGHPPAVRELFKHAAHDRLDGRKHVFLGDETHLHIELVELARRAVGAGVLVAEAGRDLEVAVKTRHHQKLLELLRRLREGVELPGVQSRRYEEVARAFRRRGGQDRGLKLREPLGDHPLAEGGDDPRAQDNVLVQTVAAQIEEPVLQAKVFRIIGLAEHRHG